MDQRGTNRVTVDALPDDVRRLIHFAIPSVPYLEALLLMRSTPGQCWHAGAIARRLYLGERTAADLLAALSAAGIAVQVPEGYAYQPRDDELAALLDKLALAYSRHLIAISQLIHSRTDAMPQQFANAFLLRR